MEDDLLNVAFLTTRHEYKRGILKSSVARYLERKPSSLKLKFHLVFLIDTGDSEEYYDLKEFEQSKFVDKVTIWSCQLSEEDNVYTKEVTLWKFEEYGSPWLGLSMGPNLLFFKAMAFLRTLAEKNTLLLETDSHPTQINWFDRCYRYTKNNDFMIAGSTYKGKTRIPKDAEWREHLNGIAIFRHSNDLKNLLNDAKMDIVKRINSGKCFQWNYDVAIHSAYKATKWQTRKHEKNLRCINIDFISNMSMETDRYISDLEVLRRCPKTVIVHKKE